MGYIRCRFFCLCPCLYLSTRLSACRPFGLSACRPVRLSACRPVRLSACPPVRLSACPPVRLSACPPVRLSACPPVRLSACPSLVCIHLSLRAPSESVLSPPSLVSSLSASARVCLRRLHWPVVTEGRLSARGQVPECSGRPKN